jgi:hypothetical protein
MRSNIMLKKLYKLSLYYLLLEIWIFSVIEIYPQISERPEKGKNRYSIFLREIQTENNVENAGNNSTDSSEDQSEYSYTGKEDNLRLGMGLGFSNIGHKGNISWKGIFDYYLSEIWSFSGKLQISLTDHYNYNHHFGGLGILVHFLQLYNFDFYLSGISGFTLVMHIDNPIKLVPTIDLGLGIIYFSSFFFLFGEFNYRLAEYYMEKIYIELYEQIFSVGVGFKI